MSVQAVTEIVTIIGYVEFLVSIITMVCDESERDWH